MNKRVSKLEEQLAYQIRVAKLPVPAREFVFAPPRRWRFDFAWLDRALAVEVEGGIFMAGRHSRGAGFRADAEKYNTATLMGWRVLKFTDREIKTGEALTWIQRALVGQIQLPTSVFHEPPSQKKGGIHEAV